MGNNNSIDYQNTIISLFLSGFYGLVITSMVDNYNGIIDNITTSQNCSNFELIVAHIFVTVFSLNLFRMLHGFIISLFDKDRNPTILGVPPYNPGELILLICAFLVPYIVIQAYLNFHSITWLNLYDKKEQIETFFLIILYTLPHITYIIWDFKLKKALDNHESQEDSKSEKEKVKNYKKFVKNWIKFDYIIIGTIIFLLIINGFKITLSRATLLLIFSMVHFGIIVVDYFFKNKSYYFPLVINN